MHVLLCPTGWPVLGVCTGVEDDDDDDDNDNDAVYADEATQRSPVVCYVVMHVHYLWWCMQVKRPTGHKRLKRAEDGGRRGGGPGQDAAALRDELFGNEGESGRGMRAAAVYSIGKMSR
jgi:hypothetical protein